MDPEKGWIDREDNYAAETVCKAPKYNIDFDKYADYGKDDINDYIGTKEAFSEREGEFCYVAVVKKIDTGNKKIITTYPKWRNLTDNCKDKWDKFIDNVKYHESMHKEMCERCYRDYENYLIANYPGSFNEYEIKGCSKDPKVARLEAVRILRRHIPGLLSKSWGKCDDYHKGLEAYDPNLMFECPCDK